MKKTLTFIFVLLVATTVFSQPGYQRKSGTDEKVQLLKNADPSYVQSLIDLTGAKDPVLPVLLSLKNEKEKKQNIQYVYVNKNTGNGGNGSNGATGGDLKKLQNSVDRNDSLLLVIIDMVSGFGQRLSNVEISLTEIKQMLNESDRKIDSLSSMIVNLGFVFNKVSEKNDLIFLKKGELMLFHSDYLAVTTNNDVLTDFVVALSQALQVRLNPLDFIDYANGRLDGEPKLLVEKVVKLIGSIDTDDPDIIWEYFVENASTNASRNRQTFEKF